MNYERFRIRVNGFEDRTILGDVAQLTDCVAGPDLIPSLQKDGVMSHTV